jgi:hypothetical protein
LTAEPEDAADGGDSAYEAAPAEAEAPAPAVDFGPLHEWLTFAFDAVQQPFPNFLAGLRTRDRGPEREPPPPSLAKHSLKFDEVVNHPALLAWVQSALQVPGIAEQFGAGGDVSDGAVRRLQGQCLDLLNDLLLLHHVMGRLPEYDQHVAGVSIEEFWAGMQRGVQIFEVGVLLYDFTSDSRQDPVPIGLRTQLRRVTPEWASLRFENASDIPSNTWTICRTVVSNVDPKDRSFVTFYDRDHLDLINEQYDRDSIADIILEQSKLALRLVLPTAACVRLEPFVKLQG